MCKYCEKYFVKIEDLKPGDIMITQRAKYLQVGSNRVGESVPMKFCPNCGAKLLETSQKVNYLVSKEATIDDMLHRIREYDNSHPKMDELNFINAIMKDYAVTRNDAIEMVQYMRRIFM